MWGVVANSFPGHCPQTWDSQPGSEDLVFEIREYHNIIIMAINIIIITITFIVLVFCSILSLFYPSKHHHLHHKKTKSSPCWSVCSARCCRPPRTSPSCPPRSRSLHGSTPAMGARSAVCNKEIRQSLKTKTNSACACDDCKSEKRHLLH